MTRRNLIILAPIVAVVFTVCARPANARDVLPADAVSEGDRAFVIAAAQSYMLQQQIGALADMNGESAQVKDLARRLADQAMSSYDRLRDVASERDIPLPTYLDVQHQAVYFRLFHLSGSLFDREFIAIELQLHDAAIRGFADEAAGGHNSDVRGFAKSELGTLRRNRENVRDLQISIST